MSEGRNADQIKASQLILRWSQPKTNSEDLDEIDLNKIRANTLALVCDLKESLVNASVKDPNTT
ncbi:MAG: hypothetical protein ACKVQS_10595 [Fimbriimonadaceae bacterium]